MFMTERDVEVASSHTPTEDRQARLSGVWRGYHEAKRCYLVTSTKIGFESNLKAFFFAYCDANFEG